MKEKSKIPIKFLLIVSRLRFSSVQFSSVLSRVWLFATPWTTARQASLSITSSWNLPKLTSIEAVIPSNHFILCCTLLLPPSIFLSIRVFSNESVLHIRGPKYWSFSLNISPSNEHQDWFHLGWTGWISLQSKGLARVFSNTTVWSRLNVACFFQNERMKNEMTYLNFIINSSL